MNEVRNFWRNRSVFVTGCTGLLGGWLIEELIDRGARVTGLVRDDVPFSKLYQEKLDKKINLVTGNVEDFATLERILAECETDTVFHLAAQAIVGVGNQTPLKTFETNIRGTWNLLEACRQVGTTSRIIVASSDRVYGNAETPPYDENTPLRGSLPYDVSKSCADLISRAYYKTYELPVCITRCGNFYGGGDLNFTRLVPDIVRSALADKPVTIRSDGSFTRDYLYVRDGVLAYLHLAEQMERPEILGEAFNFSSEIQVSVIAMVRKILALMNKPHLEPIILNQANKEINHYRLSTEKARKLLDWSPSYTLDQGLTETIEWYKKFTETQI